jgi:outer membrane receptor protein involved in Fe transport
VTGTKPLQVHFDPLVNPDGTGHNYYNNSTPYRLKSGALFGEAYFEATDTLKATLGVRYTNDRKEQTTFPILLVTPGRGLPTVTPQRAKFEEVTGRSTVDWKPSDNNLGASNNPRHFRPDLIHCA